MGGWEFGFGGGGGGGGGDAPGSGVVLLEAFWLGVRCLGSGVGLGIRL